ncbi:MAG: amidohydrolase family protein [Acidimicrobiales bacterium]
MDGLLITGGTVVDGTGAPAFVADVRVRGGIITEVGPGLSATDETIIDATGSLVAPGIIDTHTHLDGAMWWNPELDPLPAYGNTSMVFGNCGNSIAPLKGNQRDEIVDLLCFLEDLPRKAFEDEIPWSWQTWPEYMDALRTQPTAVHVAGYLGHLALRTWVMGPDAWTRSATAAEIEQMCEVLDEGLASGALGLSINHYDKDRALRLVPGYFADDAEYLALFHVVASHAPATVQMITRFNDPELSIADAKRFGVLVAQSGVRAQYTGIPFNERDDGRREEWWQLHERLQAEGADMWPMVNCKPLAPFFGFETSLVFQRVPAWNEAINGPAEQKLSTLADKAWRDRARTDWDNRTRSSLSRIDRPNDIILTISETGVGPLGISLQDLAEQTGLHISDALADWVLANGIGSQMMGVPERLSEVDVVKALRDPHTLFNINDSGAHLQLFSAAGEHLYMLTHYVRDAGLISIEEGIHALTGRTAEFFGMNDRGVIATGNVADLVVFRLDEIELRAEERAYDVPHGTWRFTRAPAGFRATIAAGEPTWLNGAATGARPGQVLRPGSSPSE